jgi:hypothetical protein
MGIHPADEGLHGQSSTHDTAIRSDRWYIYSQGEKEKAATTKKASLTDVTLSSA